MLGLSPSMCAGKLLSLIKKCLNRDRDRQQRERDRQKEKGGGRTKAHCDHTVSQCHVQLPPRSQNLFPNPNPDSKGARNCSQTCHDGAGLSPRPRGATPHPHRSKCCMPYAGAGSPCSARTQADTRHGTSSQSPLVSHHFGSCHS